MKYHWMSTYTGELQTAAGIISSVLWAIRHRKQYPQVSLWKYATAWTFSVRGW